MAVCPPTQQADIFQGRQSFDPPAVSLPTLLHTIQIIHSSEGISKNYPHKVPLEQSNTLEAITEGVWTVLKVPSG